MSRTQIGSFPHFVERGEAPTVHPAGDPQAQIRRHGHPYFSPRPTSTRTLLSSSRTSPRRSSRSEPFSERVRRLEVRPRPRSGTWSLRFRLVAGSSQETERSATGHEFTTTWPMPTSASSNQRALANPSKLVGRHRRRDSACARWSPTCNSSHTHLAVPRPPPPPPVAVDDEPHRSLPATSTCDPMSCEVDIPEVDDQRTYAQVVPSRVGCRT